MHNLEDVGIFFDAFVLVAWLLGRLRNVFHTIDFLLQYSPLIRKKARLFFFASFTHRGF